MKTKILNNKLLIGRFEWCGIPNLQIPAIKAKIDTGAKTSAIHAFDIEPIKKSGKWYVRYKVDPIQGRADVIICCQSLIIDQRAIMSSNGHKEDRYVILTDLALGGEQWPIELTLSNRDPLRFKLLLGREALNHKVIIDPALNCHQKKIATKELDDIYP
jgi:ribosomal protein S6--L-glutamate ligase